MNLFKKQTSIIGLDIGTSLIKTVKMTQKAGEYTLDSFAIEELEEGTIQSGEIKNPSSLAQSALNAVEKCNPSDKFVVVALPNFSILSEVMNMDLIPEKQMREAVMVEAERISPFDMSEIEIDYSVLDRDEENNTMKVLMVAAKQDIILSYLDFLSEAGLQPAVIDVDLFALTNIFHLNYDLKKFESCILLDIGTESTIAAFLHNGNYHSSREISVSGATFRKELEFLPEMTLDKMFEIMKGTVDGELEPEMISNALNSAGTKFVNAVGVAISYFQSSDNVDKMDFIALTGGYARIPGLANMLEVRTGAEVVVLDPFKQITYPEEIMEGYDPQTMGTTLSVAMGLATRSF